MFYPKLTTFSKLIVGSMHYSKSMLYKILFDEMIILKNDNNNIDKYNKCCYLIQ